MKCKICDKKISFNNCRTMITEEGDYHYCNECLADNVIVVDDKAIELKGFKGITFLNDHDKKSRIHIRESLSKLGMRCNWVTERYAYISPKMKLQESIRKLSNFM